MHFTPHLHLFHVHFLASNFQAKPSACQLDPLPTSAIHFLTPWVCILSSSPLKLAAVTPILKRLGANPNSLNVLCPIPISPKQLHLRFMPTSPTINCMNKSSLVCVHYTTPKQLPLRFPLTSLWLLILDSLVLNLTQSPMSF